MSGVPVVHVYVVVRVADEGYRPECTCGYQGRVCGTQDDARDEGEAHITQRQPLAYGVRNDQGFWVGVWTTREAADYVKSKGQPSHHEEVVPLYDRSA